MKDLVLSIVPVLPTLTVFVYLLLLSHAYLQACVLLSGGLCSVPFLADLDCGDKHDPIEIKMERIKSFFTEKKSQVRRRHPFRSYTSSLSHLSCKTASSLESWQVVLFASTAIALYGYDQGMMSLINTNANYLSTMGIKEEDPQVGVIVSVYYLGCAVGAVAFSYMADRYGRKPALFACLATASLGNLVMFVAGLGYSQGALAVMYLGRVIMGLGVGGVDSVVPVYSSELSSDDARGKALAQEFQSNIFGLNMAFAINLAVTVSLGKQNEWAWRIPIIMMQIYPLSLLAIFEQLPESPRWFISHDRKDDAHKSLTKIMGEEDGKSKLDELVESAKQESDEKVGYKEMFTPGHPQFHPTIITIMGQVNQALTGYGGRWRDRCWH